MTDPVSTVQNQVFPPGPMPSDAITMYQGADPARNSFTPWKAWDMRGPLLRLAWDLLRFQVMTYGKMPADKTTPIGLRDSINVILRTTDQNYQILQRLCKAGNIDISDITSQ